jgi:probable F420-dependent oxidoreductase
LGICTFATEHTLSPGELAREVEARDFGSLWFAEHSHIPLPRRTPWPGGAELPRWYYEALDPLVAMTAAAAATTRLRVGTGIALVVQRDPIQLAKEIASLDVLSGGRVDVGVGAGWNLEEMADHGTDPARRFKLLRERVEAMKAIWTMEEAEYHGELVDFGPMVALPKPVQRPHPPVYVGGDAPQGLRRAVRYGDGWMPIVGRADVDPAALVADLRRAAEEAGRDPGSLELIAFGAPEDADLLRRYAEAGASRALFFLEPQPGEALHARLDELAALAARVSNG